MRVLLSAFTCWPTESSEPGVAWRFAKELARDHQIWILTDGAPGPIARLHAFLNEHSSSNIIVCPFPSRAPELKTTAKFINIYYAWWQHNIIKAAWSLHQQHNFHIAHHLTFSRYWVGNSLVNLPIPFIWGPLGAGERPPSRMLKGLPLRYRLACHIRTRTQMIFERSRLLAQTARKAFVTFASTKDTFARLQGLGAYDIRYLPQIAFGESRLAELLAFRATPPSDRLSLVSAGRLLYWKGFDLGIHTVAELIKRGVAVEYEILNGGPMQAYLEALARNLGISRQVTFSGYQKQYSDVLTRIGKAHALLHPALHEAFGNVCLEALSMGKPVVCLDIGGPAMQVDTSCGFAAPITSRAAAVKAMADYLQSFVVDPNSYTRASDAAIRRVREHFSLNLQIEAVKSVYETALLKA
jgi:glycosyltransferase involved in cell wall biosynthesis